jgi:hypothetical protein
MKPLKSPPANARDAATSATAAAAVAATRFVPIPVVDEWIASFSRRQLVKRILRRHDRTFAVRDLRPLTDDGSLWTLPWRLLRGFVLAPLKALVRSLVPVLLARDVAMSVGRTLALAHTLDRQLAFGLLRNDDSRAQRRDDARRLRKAFDAAWANIDQRLLKQALNNVGETIRRRAPVTVELSEVLASLDDRVDRALLGLPPR